MNIVYEYIYFTTGQNLSVIRAAGETLLAKMLLQSELILWFFYEYTNKTITMRMHLILTVFDI